MKNRKMRLIIGMLIGLVFFSSSVALLMYTKQGEIQTQTQVRDDVEVYVTNRDISKGELIKEGDIELTSLPKSYLAFTPLVSSEIVGRYAKVDIFSREPLRREKLSFTKPKEEVVEISKVEKKVNKVESPSDYDNNRDTMILPLSVFKNVDETLKAGDYIDILSVIPKKSSRTGEFLTKYVAVHLLINSFVMNGSRSDSLLSFGEEGAVFHANAVVFDILPGDIKNLLSTYYKTQQLNEKGVFNVKRDYSGHLWMVKCTKELNPTIQKYKNKMLVDHVTVYKRKKRKTVEKVSISYEN